MITRKHWAAAVAASTTLAGLAVVSTPAPAPAAAAVERRVATGGAGWLAPYYTEGDLTGDDQVTEADLDALVATFGTPDDDGVVDTADLADLAQRVLYDDGPFELVEASAVDMQKAMNAGVLTSVQLTQAYLDRIAAYDGLVDATHTRALNSIITTGGADALAAAAASDAYRAANGGPRSMVDGIPIVLKDNYGTEDMPTSAGHGSWEDNQTADDSFMAAGLREAGAVVLAKATLDEWAFGFVSEYTTDVAAGSSELVASPYNLARTAGGSSGGTGASISANLGAIGFGTDTGGSIRVPSSYNQLVGVRPTVGLASRDGIVPLALSQDTGGPMARSVTDAAIALDAVVGVDPADPVTAEQAGKVPTSYTEFLDPDALDGKRVGYLTSMVPTAASNAATNRLFTQAVADLQAQGATVEPITTTALNATLNEASGSTNEFKHDLNDYIAAHLDPTVATRDLSSIIGSGRLVPTRVGTYTSRNAITQQQYETWMGTHTTAIANGEAALTTLLETNDWDAMIYPSTNGYGTIGTNMRLSPNTGMPAVTVPMGQASASEAIPGAGVNLELIGRNYAEGDLLGMAYDYEQATRHRTTPALYPALAAPAPVPAPRGAAVRRAEGYTVTVSDPEVEIGEEVTVTVTAEAASDLYAYDLDLGFDPDVLEYVGATGADADVMPYTVVTDDESGTGLVSVVGSELGTSPATDGPTTLATLTFTAVGEGSTDVTADGLTTVDGELAPSEVGEAGVAPVAVALLPAAVATTPPSVTGTPRPGQTLTAGGGAWDLEGVALAYQWLRDGVPVEGADETTYAVGVADVGADLAVRVTATLEDHAPGTATSATRVVGPAFTRTSVTTTPAPPRAGQRPTLTVTVVAPGITPLGTVAVTYRGNPVRNRPLGLVDGRATVSLPARRAGRYWLRVVYTPRPGFNPSRVTQRVTVRER